VVTTSPDALTDRLDAVDPFWNDDARPIFSDEDMRAFAATDAIEERLLAVATDAEQPLKRRFAAVEALFQGGWTAWRTGDQGPAIAAVLADAIRADKIHNRWGLPGHTVNRSGTDLLSIQDGVEQALTPLLDDDRKLTIDGSEAATLAELASYRIADLAAYLLTTRRGESFTDDPDPAARDAIIERLRHAYGAV